jgi:hypothetical protein
MAKRALPVLKTSPPPPMPGEVLYVPPVEGIDGRNCANCVMWVVDESCLIHAVQLHITGDMVCGYHVVGQSQRERFPWGVPVEPELSGLITAPPDGTKCGNCLYFVDSGSDDGAGLCFGVAGDIKSVEVTHEQTLTSKSWTPAEVNALGCCSRWRQPQ